jgi:hypothetical protein
MFFGALKAASNHSNARWSSRRWFFLYGAVTFLTLYLAFYDGHIAFKETFTRDLSMIECLVHIL